MSTSEQSSVAVSIVDCDVHPHVAAAEMADCVPEPWRSRYFTRRYSEVDTHPGIYYPPLHGARLDAFPDSGGMPGSDPELLSRQLFVEAGIDIAVLVPLEPRTKLGQPQLENALYSGLNEHMARSWLGAHNPHGRFRAAFRVCPYDVDGAVREIRKWAGDPRFVEAYIVPEAEAPLGNPRFAPILEACAAQHLPIALHVYRSPGAHVLTPVGFPSFHLETFTQWPLVFMSHLASMIFGGVFDRLPELRILCVEGGFSWVAPFLWRIDRYWEKLGRELTGAQRRPSQYVENIRFTTQPLDEPPRGGLYDMFDWLGAERVLLFASDYPHYDFDDPGWLQPHFPAAAQHQIFAGNAIELFGLPAERPRDAIDALTAVS